MEQAKQHSPSKEFLEELEKNKPDYSKEKFQAYLAKEFPSTRFKDEKEMLNLYALRVENQQAKFYRDLYKKYYNDALNVAQDLSNALNTPPKFSKN